MHWRIIPLEKHTASKNMAIDEAILESVTHNTSPPTIRFYTWQSSVSIGYFQSIADVDVNYCNKKGISVTRRITGGGALFHSKAELAYCLVAPKYFFCKGGYAVCTEVKKTYSFICQAIIDTLAELGIVAEIQNSNDVFIGTKKVSASAQVQREGVILQHGNILFEGFDSRIFEVVKNFKHLQQKEQQNLVHQYVTSVSEHSMISFNGFYDMLKKQFSKNKIVQETSLTSAEQNRVAALKKKYASPEWLQGRGKEKSRGACYFGHLPPA